MKKIIAWMVVVGAFSACEKTAPPQSEETKNAGATATQNGQTAQTATEPTELQKALAQTALFKPLPESYAKPGQTKEQEDLGRMLYYENRISKNHDISCNSCHNLATFGVDNEPTSPGHKGIRGGRNSPTTLNSAGHFAQFWDGREPDVEAQAKGPVLNPVEMAMPNPEFVVATLNTIPGYVEAFGKAFPNDKTPVTYDRFGEAVGAFERKLMTPSRWDRFLSGDHTALNDDELKGFNTFMASGCQACHNGELLGGTSYQKLGAVKPWPNQNDHGRMDVTKNQADDMFFKAPSLRNIAKTGPYYHDGSIAKLEQAVSLMAEHQLGKKLSDAEVTSIVAWLNTLTGELDATFVAKPELPPSSEKTPKPDPS